MDITKFFNHSHSDLYPNKVCVYLHLNNCAFIFVDIILEVGLTAQMACLFLILIDVAWLLSGKTEQFLFFSFVPWGHPLPASSPTTCYCPFLRCGYFMTVKWYLNLISFPQLSVSSPTIPWPQGLLLRHLFSHISCSGFPGGSVVKDLPEMQEMLVQFPGWEDPLEKGTAIHSSIVAWRIYG